MRERKGSLHVRQLITPGECQKAGSKKNPVVGGKRTEEEKKQIGKEILKVGLELDWHLKKQELDNKIKTDNQIQNFLARIFPMHVSGSSRNHIQ